MEAVKNVMEKLNPGDKTVVDKIQEVFPGAIKSADLVGKIKQTLAAHGYDDKTTLVAASLCCDEVNRELENKLVHAYGQDNWFSMGGLAGFPFAGITSFGAMAHHIPDGGNCIVIYAPHVGVDSEGVVGKVNRRGRQGSGACCGSATAAAGYVKSVMANEIKAAGNPESRIDAQQTWVGAALLPYGQRLADAADPAAELPKALFDAQTEMIDEIIGAACGEVAGEGKIAVVGGLQINTPAGTPDYFLLNRFEIKSNKNELVASLL